MIHPLRLTTLFAVLFAALAVLGGCHSDLGLGNKVFECSDSSDCMEGWRCAAAGVCVEEGALVEDTGVGDASDTDDTDDDAGEPQVDTGPDTEECADGEKLCEGECVPVEEWEEICGECDVDHCKPLDDHSFARCKGGQCVRDCHLDWRDTNNDWGAGWHMDSDGCESRACADTADCSPGLICGASNVCVAGCEQELESCDPTITDQGQFWCRDNQDGTGTCIHKCQVPGTQGDCPDDTFCIGTDAGNMCVESMCETSEDCDGGRKCVSVSQNVGWCYQDGPNSIGESCGVEHGSCDAQSLCYSESLTAETGTCAQMCDPWAEQTSCPSGLGCQPFIGQTGVCLPALTDSAGAGLVAFAPCQEADFGRACSDGSTCMRKPRSSITEASFYCIPSCRPGLGDCMGQMVCNPHLSPGQRNIGVCTNECSTDDDCPDSQVCSGSLCRYSCAGSTQCPDGEEQNWICGADGFCR